MIKTLIVDDEELARRELREMLATVADIQIVAEAANGLEAVEQIITHEPELVFLDIEMPGLNGLEVVNSLNCPPVIIFVTAYEQYAIQAFEAHALDYLLKPLTMERLVKTLMRVRKSFQHDGGDAQTAAMQRLLAQLQQQPRASYLSRIAVQKGPRIVLVSLRDIVLLTVEDKLVFVYTASGRFLINKTIYELAQMLTPQGFFQISRGTIINLEFMTELLPWFSGTYKVKLTNNQELQVSRERAPLLKEAVGIWKHNSHK